MLSSMSVNVLCLPVSPTFSSCKALLTLGVKVAGVEARLSVSESDLQAGVSQTSK